MSQWNEDLHLRYQGRFVFSIFPRGHVSWCQLKVIQGPRQTLVILASEEDNPGTFIANGAAVLATQIVNFFDLEPTTTLFLERTPPVDHHAEMRQWAAQELPARARPLPISTLFGTSEDKYERITFEWSKSSDYNEPRYTAHHPAWEVLKPVEVIRLIQDL
jgi:hypothetical protein